MGEVSDKGDEEFTAGVEADRIGGVDFESLCAIVESLDELKHGTS